VMSVIPHLMGGLWPSEARRGIIDAEHKFAKRRLDRLTRWTPTQKDILELRRLVNGKAGRDIM